jgi:hypothetical protein
MEVKDDNVGADNPSRRCVSRKRMGVVTDTPKIHKKEFHECALFSYFCNNNKRISVIHSFIAVVPKYEAGEEGGSEFESNNCIIVAFRGSTITWL